MRTCTAILVLAALVLSANGPGSAQEQPEPAATTIGWLNFDAQDAKLPEATDCTVARVENAAHGAGCLKITLPEKMEKVARVTFWLGRQDPMPVFRALRAHFRSAPVDEALSLRWFAEDSDGNALFQRKFSVDNGAVWTQQEFPLALWRWGNDFVGEWSGEVRRITLAIESRVSELCMDELCWVAGKADTENNYATPEVYEAFAFDGRCQASTRGTYRIATDGNVTPQDVDALHARLRPIVAWLKRVFGDACDPTHEGPISILLFEKREQMARFCKRLGTAWRVTITAPAAGGYTIQDIAMSNLDDGPGFERPVFFHEAVHATVARNLRLIPGHSRHSWLQEGLANYLQLCQFPESLSLATYPRVFKEGVGARTLLIPLKTLLTNRIEMAHYAQLAALTAWLVEKHADWLAVIARTLADGGKLEDALKGCKTDFESMEEDWLAWGRAKFKDDPKRDKHFDVPAEWVK